MALEKIAPIETLEPFNVTADDYETFIDALRRALVGTNPPPPTVVSPTSGVSRPVLAKETTTDTQPPRWIHVQLNGYKGVAPKVAIRSDNVYVMGFTNSQKTWFQLNDTKYKYKLVDDKAVMVGFDGNYTTLLGAKGVDALPDLNLSSNSVAEAAAKLWNWIPKAAAPADDGGQETGAVRADPQTDLKRAVATVIVAISEAARFAAVSDVINQGWYGYQAGVTTKEVGYIRDWGDLSEALLKWKNAGYKNDATIFSKFQKIGINNGEQALAVVALVKQIIRSTSSMAAAATGYGDLLAYAELPKLGRYMAEVFAVRVPAAAAGGGGHPPRGTISFHGGHYCSGFVYSHEEQDSSQQQTCCDSQGNIVLTGPSVAISAYSPIVFSLDLHDGSSSRAGRIVCDAAAGDFCSYDRAITETVETGYGPAEVTYAVLTNGVQGLVTVKLSHSRDDEDGGGVLGRVVARSKLFDDVGCVLFYTDDADNKQGVRVRSGELLPLARQALAVPLHMPLTVELDLRSSSSGDEIARGALEFNPAIEGQHTQRLVGVSGAELQVTISWSEYPW